MNSGLALWDIAPPARRNEDTQAGGAAAIAARAPALRQRVLGFVRGQAARGATNEEISAALALKMCSVCGRVNELVQLGLIHDSGQRRRALSGVEVKIWVA